MLKALYVLLLVSFLTGHPCLAQEANPKDLKTKKEKLASFVFKTVAAEFLYGNTNFKFNATSGTNFSRYQGDSQLFAIGGDQIKLRPTILYGLYLFNINTSINSQILLNPAPLSTARQRMNNNMLFGHIFKIFKRQFAVDLGAAYGLNKVDTQASLFQGTINEAQGLANYNNNNWLISLNGVYSKNWNNLQFRGNLGGLFTQIDTGSYLFNIEPRFPNLAKFPTTQQTVSALTSKTTFLFEALELGFKANEHLMPYVNAALIQVVQFSNSRELIIEQVNGAIPELNLNQNGYRIGGGIVITYKKFKLRAEEKYYNANRIFSSMQTLIGLEYQFS